MKRRRRIKDAIKRRREPDGASSFVDPVITSVVPAAGNIAGGKAVTINGTGFQNGATVAVGGEGGVGGAPATAVVFVSAIKLTCVTPPGPDSGLVTADVDAGAGTYTRSAGSFLTDGLRIGQSVAWTGFVSGGNNATKTILALTATVMTVDPAGLVDELGDGDERVSLGLTDLLVTNPDTTNSGASGFGKFTYLQAAAPVVTSITPNSGSALGGTAITNLAGTGFQNGATATVGGVDVGAVFVSSVKLTGVTGAHASGVDDVLVVNPDGQDSGASGDGLFTYASFDPTTMQLEVFERGPYAALPQPGVASVTMGPGSGGRQWQTAIGVDANASDPTVGPLLNGIAGADFVSYGGGAGTKHGCITYTTIIGNFPCALSPLVAQTTWMMSVLADVRGAPKHASLATPYTNGNFFQADGFLGCGVSADAGYTGAPTLTFDAATKTVLRSSGDFTADGFAIGQPVYCRNTTLNDGTFGGALLTLVTPSTLTFSGGVVSEVVLAAANPCLTGGDARVNVYVRNLNNAPPFFTSVSAPITLGLHWIFVPYALGHVRINIDGVAGASQAFDDINPAFGGNHVYSNSSPAFATAWMSMVVWDLMVTQFDYSAPVDLTNLTSYMDDRYARSYP